VSVEVVIAALGALAGVVAALFAWRSARTAKLALAIAHREESARRASITPYLIDVYREIDRKAKEASVFFLVSYANASTLPTSIVRLELCVYYSRESASPVHRLFSPVTGPAGVDALPIPVHIDARGTSKGTICFKIPVAFLDEVSVERYQLIATTPDDQKISLDSFLVKDRLVEQKRTTNSQ